MNLDRVCSNPTCSNMTMIVLASASISIFLMLLMTPAMITVKQRMGQREPQKRDENELHAMDEVHFDQFSAVTNGTPVTQVQVPMQDRATLTLQFLFEKRKD